MNYFRLLFSGKSILRVLQQEEFDKFELKGDCLEFGAKTDLYKNFLNKKSSKYSTSFSNIIKNEKFIFIDLEKKTKHKRKYDNIVFFNVLEHLSKINTPFQNLRYLLKEKGKVLGSTPFLYRIHGAPKDYTRFTKENLKKILTDNKFINVKIKELGTGPFLASISLLRSYLKYLFIIYQLLIISALILDKLLFFFMKTDPKKIYPIGYLFSATKK